MRTTPFPLLKALLVAFLVCYNLWLSGQAIKQVGPEHISFPNEAYFAENGRVFLSTQGGIYSSDNDGGQWKKVNTSFNGAYYNTASFVKNKDGKIYSWDASGIHYTSDNGDTWHDWFVFFVPSPFSPINSIVPQGDTLFVAMKEGVGFAVKDNAFIESFAPFVNKNIVRLEVKGNTILAIGSDSKVYLSLDRGKNWTNNPDLPFVAGEFPLKKFDRKGNILVTTHDADFWISTDFGKSWMLKNKGLPVNQSYSLRDVQIEGDEVFLANGSAIFKSLLDLSAEWQTIFTAIPYQSVNFVSIQGSRSFIGGNKTLIKSSDGGATWTTSSINGIYDARVYLSANGSDGSIFAYGGTGMFKKKPGDSHFSDFADIYNQVFIEGDFIYSGGSNISKRSSMDGSYISSSSVIPNSLTWSSADEVNHIKNQFFVCLPDYKGLWKLTDQNEWQEFNVGLSSLKSSQIQSLDTLLYVISDNALYQSGIVTPKWVKLNNGSSSPISAYALKDSIVVTSSYYGDCHISTDRGMTWKEIGKSILDNGPTAFFFDNKTLLVSTYKNLYWTKDLGETWGKSSLIDSLKYIPFVQSILATEDSIYMGTTENGILALHKELLTKQSQAITFNALTDKTFGAPAFNLTATASSGLSVKYSCDSDKISIAGNQVTLLKAGRVTIAAEQSGDSNFNAAFRVSQSFCINPAKPIITTTGLNTGTPLFTSSSESGNQWFKDGALIPNAVSSTLIPTEPGSYSVKTTVDNCISVQSAPQVLVITGDINSQTTSEFMVYPNPVKDELIISLRGFDPHLEVGISIYDAIGQEIEKTSRQGDYAIFSVRAYVPGFYFVKASQKNRFHKAKFLKE